MVVLIGCAETRESTPSIVERDSAGIRIVESFAPELASSQFWRVSDAPLITIGDENTNAPIVLNQVRGAVRLSDKRIAILNAGEGQLLLYDSGGALLGVSGRKGMGPGEFRSPQHLQKLAGDTLKVWEEQYGPISIFDPIGRFVRQEHIDLGRLMELLGPGRLTEAMTPLPDGSFVAHISEADARSAPRGALFRPPIAFVRIDSALTRADLLGWYGGIPQLDLDVGGRSVRVLPLFLTHARVTGSGDPIRLYISDGEAYAIRVTSADGATKAVYRRLAEPRRISDADRQAAKARRREIFGRTLSEPELNRMFAQLPEEKYYPPNMSITVDPVGFLWVLSPGEQINVFAPNGRWSGQIPLRLIRLFEVGDDYLLGVNAGDGDVQNVVLYSLRRS